MMHELFATPMGALFTIFGVMSLAGALAMVFSKNAVHSVIGFLFTMLSIAACYLCLEAEFLAMAQVLVYAGGIVVLFLFVVMLVELSKRKDGRANDRGPMAVVLPLVALLAAAFGAVFGGICFARGADQALNLPPDLAQGMDVAGHNAQAISRGLFAGYLLPFEILSVILLVALVGAVVLAKTERV